MPDAHGYCLAKLGARLSTAEEVEALCPDAGEWESECRYGWVAGRMTDHRYTTQALLEACGPSDDCAFELLDARPLDDVLAQAEACTTHAGRHARDCFGHALQRWWMDSPDAEDRARVFAAATANPDRQAYYAAVYAVCEGEGSCEDLHPQARRDCTRYTDDLTRNPGRCPKRRVRKLNPGSGGSQGHPAHGAGAQPGSGLTPPPAGH